MRLIRGTRLFSKDFVVAGLQGSRFQLAQTLDLDRECFLQWSCFLLAAIPSSLPWTLSHRQKASWRSGSLQHHRWSSQPLFVAQFDDPVRRGLLSSPRINRTALVDFCPGQALARPVCKRTLIRVTSRFLRSFLLLPPLRELLSGDKLVFLFLLGRFLCDDLAIFRTAGCFNVLHDQARRLRRILGLGFSALLAPTRSCLQPKHGRGWMLARGRHFEQRLAHVRHRFRRTPRQFLPKVLPQRGCRTNSNHHGNLLLSLPQARQHLHPPALLVRRHKATRHSCVPSGLGTTHSNVVIARARRRASALLLAAPGPHFGVADTYSRTTSWTDTCLRLPLHMRSASPRLPLPQPLALTLHESVCAMSLGTASPPTRRSAPAATPAPTATSPASPALAWVES